MLKYCWFYQQVAGKTINLLLVPAPFMLLEELLAAG
jgi:hypothetical protein